MSEEQGDLIFKRNERNEWNCVFEGSEFKISLHPQIFIKRQGGEHPEHWKAIMEHVQRELASISYRPGWDWSNDQIEIKRPSPGDIEFIESVRESMDGEWKRHNDLLRTLYSA